jgi:hypothetical protein
MSREETARFYRLGAYTKNFAVNPPSDNYEAPVTESHQANAGLEEVNAQLRGTQTCCA